MTGIAFALGWPWTPNGRAGFAGLGNSDRGHMTPIDQSIRLSIGATGAPSLRPKEKAMYNEGFVVAVILGLFAFLLPVLWIGWWLLADLGDRANRTHGAPHYESAKPGLGPAA